MVQALGVPKKYGLSAKVNRLRETFSDVVNPSKVHYFK